MNQSLAMAYAMKRRSQKREPEYDARGGIAGAEGRSGYSHQNLPCPQCESGHCAIHGADRMEHGGDVVDRIMRKDLPKMSEGGRVANQEHGEDDEDLADFAPNEFDDLVLRDDLHENYTEANSGDELGNEREDDDRHDIVARIMRSQGKKDRMPAGYGRDR